MDKINKLKSLLEEYYLVNWKDLLFHGWHHIVFVWKKSIIFANYLNANQLLVQASALTHDLNYLIDKKSSAKKWEGLRIKFLEKSWFTNDEIQKINLIILEEEMFNRDNNISIESKALSDADTLFKSLPITPVMFTGKYILENGTNIKSLSEKIINEQETLMNKDIYFYSDYAKKQYLFRAKTNLNLWKNINSIFDDEDIMEMLDIAKNNKVI